MDEANSQKIVGRIKKVKRNAEFTYLKTKEEVTQSLNEDYRILVASEEYVDIARWPETFQGSKEAFILTKQGSRLLQITKPYLTVSADSSVITSKIMDNLMANLDVIKENSAAHQKPSKANEQVNEHKEENKVQSSEEEQSKGKEEKDNQQDKQANNSNSNLIEEDANTKKPVPMEHYPNKYVPVEQLREDQDDFETFRNGKRPDSTTTIGIWSPCGGGTTTFTISFAIYMSQIADTIAVVEMPNPKRSLYGKLFRYQPHPKDWISFFEATKTKSEHKDRNPDVWHWLYNNIMWYPIGPYDSRLVSTKDEGTFHQFNDKYFNNLFMNAQGWNDFVFVDFPSELDEHAKYVLSRKIDQLWIILDERTIEEKGWHDFIHSDHNGARFKTKLIFNGEGKLARHNGTAKKMAEQLNIDLLAAIPYADREIRNNIYYQKYPPNQNRKLKRTLEPVYYQIAKQLVGEDRASKVNWRKQFIYQMNNIRQELKTKFNPEVDSN